MKVSVPCAECHAKIHFGDDHCPSCGVAVSKDLKRALRQRLEASDSVARERGEQLRKASQILLILAALFVLGGAVSFFTLQNTADQALGNLSRLPDGSEVTVEGKQYTVRALREIVAREPYQALVLHGVLAAMMVGFYFWSKRAPFPALVTALAVFVTVHAVSAVLDPKTIFMGIFIKVIAVIAFVRGIRAALEHRQIERGSP